MLLSPQNEQLLLGRSTDLACFPALHHTWPPAMSRCLQVLLADCYIINGKINCTNSECVAATFRPWVVTTIGM